MIATEMLKGQGLGNQLFCYITTRCIALENNLEWAVLGEETMANNIHSNTGMYFMDLDYGKVVDEQTGKRLTVEDFKKRYDEKEDRIFIGNSKHDLQHGCYVTGVDEKLLHPEDDTLYMGNMQAEAYYIKYKDQIREWLKVKPEYDTMEYSQDDLCIMHLRCSDYLDCPELYLQKKYWVNGMKHMKTINPNMRFMIVTNDVKEASKILPGIPAYNFDLATDYAIIKNAKYLLLSNSSFTYFPAFTSTTVKYILAPKYWARHNVSDGYWASEQNIYEGFHYMDRKGKVFTSEECREELEQYKQNSPYYKRLNIRPEGDALKQEQKKSDAFYKKYKRIRFIRAVKRKLKLLLFKKA